MAYIDKIKKGSTTYDIQDARIQDASKLLNKVTIDTGIGVTAILGEFAGKHGGDEMYQVNGDFSFLVSDGKHAYAAVELSFDEEEVDGVAIPDMSLVLYASGANEESCAWMLATPAYDVEMYLNDDNGININVKYKIFYRMLVVKNGESNNFSMNSLLCEDVPYDAVCSVCALLELDGMTALMNAWQTLISTDSLMVFSLLFRAMNAQIDKVMWLNEDGMGQLVTFGVELVNGDAVPILKSIYLDSSDGYAPKTTTVMSATTFGSEWGSSAIHFEPC